MNWAVDCRRWHYAFTVYAHAGAGTHTYADMKASAYKYNQGTLGFFVGSFLQLLNTRFSLRISLHGDNFLCTDNQKQSNETTLLHSNLVKTKTLIHRGWCEQMLVKTRNLQWLYKWVQRQMRKEGRLEGNNEWKKDLRHICWVQKAHGCCF